MTPNPDLPLAFSGMHIFIEKYGDEIWEMVCNHFDTDKPFKTSEAAELVYRRYWWSRGTAHRHTLAVLRNVAEQPLPDGVAPAIRRLGHTRWSL